MTGKRKRYSADFKAKVALEALRGELTTAQLASKHGIHQTMVGEWKKQAMEGLAAVFSDRSPRWTGGLTTTRTGLIQAAKRSNWRVHLRDRSGDRLATRTGSVICPSPGEASWGNVAANYLRGPKETVAQTRIGVIVRSSGCRVCGTEPRV